MDKSELVEESQSEEYTSYVYDLWKKATCLAHRVYSRGEKETMMFLGRKESKKTKHARVGKVKNTAKMNGLIKGLDKDFVIITTLNDIILSSSV